MVSADPQSLLRRHASRGVLIDANLLLLFLAGVHDRESIGRNKRLNVFTAEDFDGLAALVAQFRKIYATPHVLAEVSNLVDIAFKGRLRKDVFRSLAAIVERIDERYVPATTLAKTEAFTHLGLSDAGIVQLASDSILVLTVDLPLTHTLRASGLPVINFNHVRHHFWS